MSIAGTDGKPQQDGRPQSGSFTEDSVRPGILLSAIIVGLCLAGYARAQDEAASAVVLDTTGFWRVHYTLSPPVLKTGDGLRELPTKTGRTPPPPTDWRQPDFDDSGWTRIPGAPFPAYWRIRRPFELTDAGFTNTDHSSPALALVSMRGKFHVTDPAAVKALRLSASFRGGVAVYVNGKEVTRAHLPVGVRLTPETLAEEYPLEAYVKRDGSLLACGVNPKDPEKEENHRRSQLRLRHITDVAVGPGVLRKGANVLALEVHRAPYHEALYERSRKVHGYTLMKVIWSSCGLETVRLVGQGAGVVPNATRPKGFQVWNSQPLNPDFDLDWGDPGEALHPVRIVGTRGGNFSGKVVVGCDEPIKGLQARVSDFARAKGAGRIPASAARVRYAVPSGWEAVPSGRYPALPDLFDALAETPAAEVPVRVKKKPRKHQARPGQPESVFGAVVPVWVTVQVPEGAAPGDYGATLSIEADGLTPVEVPVQLKVCAWKLPPPWRFRTVVDLVQSPESVALHYDVPPYGEQHYRLLEKSLDRLGYVGNWTLYVPLICRTNQGNEQSMVRWVRQPDGSYRHDFTVFDRYLDLAEKHMGKPRIVCLYVWDLFLGGRVAHAESGAGFSGKALERKPVPVTLLDPLTGEVSTLQLPGYETPETRAFWKSLAEAVRQRLERRGLEQAMMLGMASDGQPSPEFVSLMAELFPGVPWMRHGHWQWKKLGVSKAQIGYQAALWTGKFLEEANEGVSACHGWKRPENVTTYLRTTAPNVPLIMSRLFGEFNIQGRQRGFGRIGLDFWGVLKGAGRGSPKDLIARYPENAWRALDKMVRAFVPPGPDGASGSARLEMMREGLQECEARIFVENALLDDELRERLGEGLEGRCRAVLDERMHSLIVNLETQQYAGFERKKLRAWLNGFEHQDVGYNYDGRRATLFFQWYLHSGWQERSEKLYSVAAEVAEALKQQ